MMIGAKSVKEFTHMNCCIDSKVVPHTHSAQTEKCDKSEDRCDILEAALEVLGTSECHSIDKQIQGYSRWESQGRKRPG